MCSVAETENILLFRKISSTIAIKLNGFSDDFVDTHLFSEGQNQDSDLLSTSIGASGFAAILNLLEVIPQKDLLGGLHFY